MTQMVTHKTRKSLFPQLETEKNRNSFSFSTENIFLNRKPLKKRKIENEIIEWILMNFSCNSHGAENPKASFMLAKRSVFSRERG